jgi:pimeloyl-ACP methyl ester carboxylesterase
MTKIPGNGCFFSIRRISSARATTAHATAILILLPMFAIGVFPALQAQHRTSAPAPVVRTITVENGVNLEVLDWGGTGRPLVFLAGLGATAHDFDKLAPQFTEHHHVYAITRRGFGASSKPAPTVANYSAERLGEDVLIVIQSLKLDHPVLAGHSIAGEELSWIGSQHPGEVAGLIYLDSVDSYSFYDPAQTDMVMDMVDVRHQIDAFEAGEPLSTTVLGQIRDSAAALAKSSGRMADNVAMAGGREDPAPPPVGLAIFFGKEKFTTVHAPMLAIMACPHAFAPLAQIDAKAAAILTAKDRVRCTEQLQFLKAHVPSAQIVVLPNADHYIYHSNEADVIRAMQAFLAKLP